MVGDFSAEDVGCRQKCTMYPLLARFTLIRGQLIVSLLIRGSILAVSYTHLTLPTICSV